MGRDGTGFNADRYPDAGLRAKEALGMNRLEPRQQLKSQEAAEREGHLALLVAVDVLAIDFHLGAMAQDARDHRSGLG